MERAAQLVGDDPTVLEHLGDAYLAKGDQAQAKAALGGRAATSSTVEEPLAKSPENKQ